MDKDKFLEKITQLFTRHGAVHYGPEPVTLMHHSMQCAQLAQAAGADDALIVAAGLHDIGHMVVLAEGRRYTAATITNTSARNFCRRSSPVRWSRLCACT